MTATRAEIRNPQPVNLAQLLDLFPDFRHGAGIEHLQFKPAHVIQHRARTQLHQHRKRRDFPKHHLGP